MADHIYTHNMDNTEKERTVSGWVLNDVKYGQESMKMGIYKKTNSDGNTEYALVFRGSILELNLETYLVWKNNIEQCISPLSVDMQDAISYSKDFISTHGDYEVTFIGHSKGGAEALAGAVATNRNAKVFNPAKPNFTGYGLSTSTYTGTATSYVVNGEILNKLFGEPGIGSVIYLDLPNDFQISTSPSMIMPRVRETVSFIESIERHMMDSVFKGLEERMNHLC